MADDGVYLRRVKDPQPMLEQLARQVVDLVEDGPYPGVISEFTQLARAARHFGVPLAYVLDERERRVRAGRTPEKGEG